MVVVSFSRWMSFACNFANVEICHAVLLSLLVEQQLGMVYVAEFLPVVKQQSGGEICQQIVR